MLYRIIGCVKSCVAKLETIVVITPVIKPVRIPLFRNLALEFIVNPWSDFIIIALFDLTCPTLAITWPPRALGIFVTLWWRHR
jgi:hypothetical protein